MSTNCYFVTGFPGFISSNLLHRLAKLHVGSRFLLLVLPEQIAKARSQVETLAKTYSESTFEIIHGDITKADLGIAPNEYTNIRESITHVIHLAAIYDLAVPDHVSHKVNVLGTDNVNKFVLSLTALKRYVYFSTAYVSGKRRGKILETDLDFNQSFKNYYELSKFRAEKLVQEIMSRVPTTIIRPSVVVGDSKTGETAKFDGPYFVMGFLNRFKRLPLPYIGKSKALINVVPVDYIADGTAHLIHSETAIGKVFHLTDPFPYSVFRVYERIYESVFSRKPAWTSPVFVVKLGLRIPQLRRIFGVPKELMNYFDFTAIYDTTQARAELSKVGIACPDLFSYLPVALDYYKKFQNDPEKIVKVK